MKATGVVHVVTGAAQGLELLCFTLADRCENVPLALRLRKLALALTLAQQELHELAAAEERSA